MSLVKESAEKVHNDAVIYQEDVNSKDAAIDEVVDSESIEQSKASLTVWLISFTVATGGFLFGMYPAPHLRLLIVTYR